MILCSAIRPETRADNRQSAAAGVIPWPDAVQIRPQKLWGKRATQGEDGSMTYCLGMRTKNGIVLIADTRTNAGIDNISNFRKLHTLAETPERVIVCASAGSLSTTQTMLSLLEEGLDPIEPSEERRTVGNMPSMFRVVSLVGEALMIARRQVTRALSGTGINSDVSLLVAGRIGGGPLALFLVYSERIFRTRLDLMGLGSVVALGDGPALLLIGQAVKQATAPERTIVIAVKASQAIPLP
jgi:hypothetical protein